MRSERTERRDREVENEPAVRGPASAQDSETNQERVPNDDDDNDGAPTRRGSSSERSER